MKKPKGKDYGIGVGYRTDVPYNIIGYNTALKEYIDYLEKKLNTEDESKCIGCETKLEPTFDKRKYCPNMKCKLDFQ